MNETWNDKPLGELMEHIVRNHHAFCRQEMARIGTLFKKAASNASAQPELKRMESLFSAMAKELAMHLVKEEQTLFPYIARVEDAVKRDVPASWPPFGTVENPIRMMVLEHEQTGAELSEIRHLSGDYTAAPDAPEPLIALYDALRAFDRDMSEHIHSEDHILFPRAIAMEERTCGRR